MNLIFSPPSLDDLIRLLKAWRFWLLSALFGGLLGATLYYLAPPPFRAQATVNVDFNLEEAWPGEEDRRLFYYLERETRKLEEIAWSDDVMKAVAVETGNVSVQELRNEILSLSQPQEAGWHLYADASSPERAQSLAAAWAVAFEKAAQSNIDSQSGLNALIRVDALQVVGVPVSRSKLLSGYLFSGVTGAWFLSALFVLFFEPRRRKEPNE
ncbi:MAG TPA: hypothetical protein DCY42_09785 [Chloroflexi bacterium]|nr:hypothetical protein [Chloroflexota bacterium]